MPPPVVAPELTTAVNPLEGRRLRYLIGTTGPYECKAGEAVMVSYLAGAQKPGPCVWLRYGNLFDEHNTGRYGPYLHTSETARYYNEGQIDPRGAGFARNLREQFERARRLGFAFIELDNPDAYQIADVIAAIDLAETFGLKVIAKNPGLLGDGAVSYVAHRNVFGIIVERGARGPAKMDALRRAAGKPTLQTWFVSFGGGYAWTLAVAKQAKAYAGMSVTFSTHGEYGSSADVN